MVWYDDHRIERTVTRPFVVSHLLPEEVDRLDRPLGFGDGLTDGTYWEWIDQKAKKIFLILVDLGVPDQIFGVIDDSWDDDDLPIARDHVERLALLPTRDDRFDRKFYQRQFHYLLKPLARSDTVAVYDDMDVVPVDALPASGSGGGGSGGGSSSSGGGSGGHHRTSSTDAPAPAPGASDKVVLPNYPGMVFQRRRIPLAQLPTSAYGQPHGQGYMTLADFQYNVSTIRAIQNDHLVSFWTAYVHQGVGHVLFTPAADSSVKALLATTPAPIKNLAKHDRRRLVFNWIHCLVDTLCFVHGRGLHHGNIRPSNVLLAFQHHTGDNHVFFSDFTQFAADSVAAAGNDKASFSKESYDYAAPEQWYRPAGTSGGGSGGSSGFGGGFVSSSSSRKSMLTGEGGSGGRGAGMSMYAGSVHGDRDRRKESLSTTLSRSPEHAAGATGYAFQMGASGKFSISRNSTAGLPMSSAGGTGYGSSAPQLNAQAADIFSLGCIILELLTFMLKRPTRAFAAHRAAKHKTPGRGGAVLDASFHKNLGQVESWMAALAKDAAASLAKKKKDDAKDDRTLAGVAPMLHVVERMLALPAAERPSAYDVQTRMYQILRDHCGILEPHCVHEYGSRNAAWDVGRLYRDAAPDHPADAVDAHYPSSPRLATSFSSMSLGSAAVSPTTASGGYSWSSSGAHFPHSPGIAGRTPSGRRPGQPAAAASVDDSVDRTERPGEPVSGLQAIRNIQLRDKVRQWNAPVYA